MTLERICCVVGARPNYMKTAPVVTVFQARGVRPTLVHTDQHYDERMSKVFFDELGMPRPDVNFGIGSDSHARQTAKVMTAFDEFCEHAEPDLVLVGGDVNSTVAVALVCAKRGIRVGHVESGLRSFDRTMPEELNRILTDHIADLLFVTEASGVENLLCEGRPREAIHLVGNTMIDTLDQHIEAARNDAPWKRLGLEERGYVLVTLHRPANVDSQERLCGFLDALEEISANVPVVFPVHPRTSTVLGEMDRTVAPGITLCEPMPYLEFLGMMAAARCVVTDSGGIQEETTALGVPCVTARDNTERPITLAKGTNRLAGAEPLSVLAAVKKALAAPWPQAKRPDLWDGHAAERIVDVILG